MTRHTYRFWTFFALIAALLAAAACKSDEDRVAQTAERYAVNDALVLELKNIPLHVDQDREILEEQAEAFEDVPFDADKVETWVADRFSDDVDVTIDSTEIDGDKATVEVDVEGPSPRKVNSIVNGRIRGATAGAGEDEDKTDEVLENLAVGFDKADIDRETSSHTIELRKVEGDWKIFANVEQRGEVKKLLEEAKAGEYASREENPEETLSEARDKIAQAKDLIEEHDLSGLDNAVERTELVVTYGEATYLEKEGEYIDAAKRYEEILERDPSPRTAPNTLENLAEEADEMEKKAELQKAEESYPDHIEFSELEADNDRFSPKIVGEVSNDGDYPIHILEVVANLKDGDGNDLHQTREAPAVFAPGGGEHLKPGDATEFSIHTNDAPSEWDDDFELEIVRLELAHE